MPKRVRVKLPSGWRVEAVVPRMRKGCDSCDDAIKEVRLVRTVDGYPFPTTEVYCKACAVAAMRQVIKADEKLIDAFEESHGPRKD